MSKPTVAEKPKLSGEALAAARRANGRKGGRPPGALNKATVLLQAQAGRDVEAMLREGPTPLQVMLMRMRDPSSVTTAQFKAAEAAAPYVHPKLTAVAYKRVSESPPIDFSQWTDVQLEALQ